MSYKEIIANSLQKIGPTSINMHKIENHFIMDIDYSKIVDAIVDDLENNGYTINTHQ
jgi:ribosomal protein S8